jgi:hypothetical protein
VLFRTEVVVGLNTDGEHPGSAHVTIDAGINAAASRLRVLYRSNWSDAQLRNPPQDEFVAVASAGGRRTVRLDLPAAGMVILSA